MKTLMILLGLIFALYSAILLATYAFQRKLQYFPSLEYFTPKQAGLTSVEEVKLATPDGEKLVAWYAKAASGKPTILYFHGNGAGLIDRADRIRKYQASGTGFFIAAYRGYAGSSGTPSEKSIVADAHLAYDYLIKEGVLPQNIVVFGESLGTSVATQLAASVKTGALVLESPFTSAVDVGAMRYPCLPVRRLMNDQYLTHDFMGKVHVPTLVVHGGQDQIIPLEMGKQIFKLANEPKQFILLPEAGHNNHDQFGLVPKVQEFMDKYISG